MTTMNSGGEPHVDDAIDAVRREIEGQLREPSNGIHRPFGTPKSEWPPAAEAAPEPAGNAVETVPDLERFLATGEKLFAKQRQKINSLISRYGRERLSLADSYRIRIEEAEHALAELEREGVQALRELDKRHDGDMAAARRIMDSLTAMRGE